MSRNRRRNRNGGQAVLETALIIPLMLFLIFNFLAIMVQVVYQQEMTSAVNLAATSTLGAPVGDAGTANSYAQGSFNGTFKPAPWVQVTKPLSCSGAYFTGRTGNGAITCTASAQVHFNQGPLGAFVWWAPTISATASVNPSTVRQCGAITNWTSTQQC